MELASDIYWNFNTDHVAREPKSFAKGKGYSGYWIGLGLPHVLPTPIASNGSVEDMIKDIEDSNLKFFKSPVNFVHPLFSLDGTACVGKTTLTQRFQSIKTTRLISSVAMDSHPMSSLGYHMQSQAMFEEFCKKYENDLEPLVSDRTSWNNYLWGQIWKILAFFSSQAPARVNGNSYTDIFSITKTLEAPVYSDYTINMMKSILTSLHFDVYEDLLKFNRSIFIIDTDEESVRKRMADRNEGADYERSTWGDYVRIQTFAYAFMAQMFPEYICLIDLNKYKNLTFGEKLQGIETLIRTHYDYTTTNIVIPERPLMFEYQCSPLTESGVEHERRRPSKMDAFTTDLKVFYETDLRPRAEDH